MKKSCVVVCLTVIFSATACSAPQETRRREPRVRTLPFEAPPSALPKLAHCESVELPPLPSQVVFPEARQRSEEAVTEALQRYHEGALAQALALTREAVEADPYAFRAHMTAGVVSAGLKNPGQALLHFCQARRLDESSRKALYWIGYCYLEMQRHEQGIRAMRELTRIDPENARAWYELGFALLRQEEHEAALAALERCLALNADNAPALYERGFALYRLGRHEAAAGSYQRAAKLRPTHVDTWKELAETAFLVDDLKTARRAARRVVRLDPKAPEGPLWLGRVLVKRGRCRKGLAELDKAFELAPAEERTRYEKIREESGTLCHE